MRKYSKSVLLILLFINCWATNAQQYFNKLYEEEFNMLAFKAIFIDKDFQPIESGKSDSFIICQTNKNLIPIEITYLKNEFKYAKTIFVSKYKISFLDEKEQIIINNIEDLKNILELS